MTGFQPVFFGQPSKTKWKAGRPRLGLEDVVREDLREIGTSGENIRREAVNRLGWTSSLCCFVCLMQLGVAVSC